MKNEEEFKKQDEALMKDLESLRREPLPPNVTRGFTESVEARIREKQAGRKSWMQWHVPAATLVPVFAVLVLGFTMTLRTAPQSEPMSSPAAWIRTERSNARPILSQATQVKVAYAGNGDVDETIALLTELGELEGDAGEEAAIIEESLVSVSDLNVSRAANGVNASA